MIQRLFILLSTLTLVVACGGGDSGGGGTTDSGTTGGGEITPSDLPANTITKQESISEGEWNKVIPNDQDLGMFKTQFAAEGYK